MASVLHRITKEFRSSANTPDYPVEDYIINPDMTAVVGFQSKYWVITGDVVSLMSEAEQAAVDAAELEAQNDAIADTIDVDPYLRSFALVVLDEINLLRSNDGLGDRTIGQLKTAVRSNL